MKNNQDIVDKYLNDWKLANPAFIDVESACSDVFIVDMDNGKKAALKIRHGRGIEAERFGANALNFFQGRGVVKLYKSDERAHLLEYVDGHMLRTVVDTGNDNSATQIICDVIGELHSMPLDTPPILNPLETHCAELFTQSAKAKANSELRKAAQIGQELLSDQDNPRPLHGDVHHENILMSQRGWLLIDPNGLIGDPIYEFANTFNNPINDRDLTSDINVINSRADIISSSTGYDRQKILKYAVMHMGLSASWHLSSGHDKTAQKTLNNCGVILKLLAT